MSQFLLLEKHDLKVHASSSLSHSYEYNTMTFRFNPEARWHEFPMNPQFNIRAKSNVNVHDYNQKRLNVKITTEDLSIIRCNNLEEITEPFVLQTLTLNDSNRLSSIHPSSKIYKYFMINKDVIAHKKIIDVFTDYEFPLSVIHSLVGKRIDAICNHPLLQFIYGGNAKIVDCSTSSAPNFGKTLFVSQFILDTASPFFSPSTNLERPIEA